MEKYFERFSEENYYTKGELKYRIEKTEIEKIWNSIVSLRRENGHATPFESQEGIKFFYYIRKIMKENISKLESSSKINLTDRKLAKKIYNESLIDEAMSSSAIEGAFSTRRRTEELVQGICIPTTKDEKIILNNYNALQFIDENNDVLITDELIIELHNIITSETLEECDITERYRDDIVMLEDANHKVIYEAPNCELVEGLMSQLINYINKDTDENIFIKASIIQFMFLYIHPFFDGNGRTARALSYMYLIKKGYKFFKFFSISYVVNEYKANYYKSILKCEDEYSDLTYFIDFNIEMMFKAVRSTLEKYDGEYLKSEVEKYIKNYKIHLTPSQSEALRKYLKRSDKHLSIKKYSKLSGVSEGTSIKHFSYFVKNKILNKIKIGDEKVYIINKLENFIELNNKS